MTTCNRCGKGLTVPASQKLGYGPICWAKITAPSESGDDSPDAVTKLPFDTATMDVACLRTADGNQFNIPQALVLHSPTGMEWGYCGSGPADFALNILYRFTQDKRFSEAWHQPFKCEFVAGLPKEGGTIRGKRIVKWINQRRGLENAKSMLLPGFRSAT